MHVWRAGHLSRSTAKLYLTWVRRFRAYCAGKKLDEVAEMTRCGATRFVDQCLGSRNKGPVGPASRATCLTSIHAWACALRAIGTTVPAWLPASEPAKLSPLLTEYCKFRHSHCGVAEGTLLRDVVTAEEFLALLKRRRAAVGRAKVSDIDAFAVQLSQRLCTRSIQDRCSSLRAFLRFLQTTGRSKRTLANSVLAPHIHVVEKPPRALPWTDVQRILKAVTRSEPPGKRDFAMLLLMATYGLGAAEVLSLRFKDVDWRLRILRLRRPKTGASIELPLLGPAAKALTAYIRAERPPSASSQRVFVRARMPYAPITSSAIRFCIRRYARQAGIQTKVIGAHALRHSHATRQVDSGANLKTVSDILGHRRPSSTSVYVRVALNRLRDVALPVPR